MLPTVATIGGRWRHRGTVPNEGSQSCNARPRAGGQSIHRDSSCSEQQGQLDVQCDWVLLTLMHRTRMGRVNFKYIHGCVVNCPIGLPSATSENCHSLTPSSSELGDSVE